MSEIRPATAFAYAAPAFALAVVGIPVYVYLPKLYADVAGVSLAALGPLLLLVRVFDAVTDPLVGWLSDRTRTRWGRRRPWILLGAPPLAVAFLLLCLPPAPGPLGVPWLAAGLFALFLFWTVVQVPYESLGLELSDDFDRRTRLLGLRDAALVLGTIGAAAAPVILAHLLDLGADEAGQRARFRALGLIYAPLLIATCAVCALLVPERPVREGASTSWRAGLAALRENRPFARLLASWTVNALGSNLPGALLAFYVAHVLGSQRVGEFLLLYFAAGVVCLPAWVRLARAWDKKPVYLLGTLVNTGVFGFTFFLERGDELLYAMIVTASGTGLGATLAIASSMQADVAEYDQLLGDGSREGSLIGVWAVARKLSGALGVGLAFPLLAAAGYREGVADQPPEVLGLLRLLYAGVPVVMSLLGLLILLPYPLDRARHAAVQRALAERRAGRPAPDPLAAEAVA